MPNASQRLVDLVRQAHGGCSDYRVGKLLNVSTSAVSRWRTGVGHMSTANVVAACTEAGIKDVFRWEVMVGAEREQGKDGDFYRSVRDEFHTVERGRKLPKNGFLYPFVYGLRGLVTSILLAVALVFGVGNAVKTEAAEHSPAGSQFAANVSYVKRGRRRPWWHFATWFPLPA